MNFVRTPGGSAGLGETKILQGEEGEHVRRLDRSIFTDPELFEQEFSRIWERIWIFVGHESQIPGPRSYITSWVGRVPIIINRNKEGVLNAFVNVCTHRGSTLCRESRGTKTNYACPFHGWVFDLDGRLVAPLNEGDGSYPPDFDKSKLGLRRVKLGNYRGFLFASLNDEVEPLEDHLAFSKTFIDIIVDQAPQGVEVLKGSSTYIYRGNWKMQGENGVDGYHVSATHGNYVETIAHRAVSKAAGEKTKTMNVASFTKQRGGFYDLGNGHTLLWSEWTNPQDRPLYPVREQLAERIGKAKAEWAINRMRNMLIYPNLFLMDQMSSQIRVFRPLAVDKTEVTIYCFAPIGEAPEARAKRIRQYEDFFNASGMATPDDLTEFRESQRGCSAHSVVPWSDMSRGVMSELHGPDDVAEELGITPALSGVKPEDEGIFVPIHRRWMQLMGLEG